MKKFLACTICAFISCFAISTNAAANSISSYNKEIGTPQAPNVRTETITTAVNTDDGGTIVVVRVIVYVNGQVASDTMEIVVEARRP